MMIAASWSGGWTKTKLKVGAEDGMAGADADIDLLKKDELKWRRKIDFLKGEIFVKKNKNFKGFRIGR